MGRRSINTTKSGKYMNPTDQARKEARKRELKKNKKQRMAVRQAVLKGKDPSRLLDDMEIIDKMEYDPTQPPKLNEKVLKDKRKKLKETFDRVIRMYEKEDPEYSMELRKMFAEYDQRRMQLQIYFEQVKNAERVQLDQIPLPDAPDMQAASQIPLPGDIPMPSADQRPLHSILKKSGAPPGPPPGLPPLHASKRKPPGPPPGTPPMLSDSEPEEEAVPAIPVPQPLPTHDPIVAALQAAAVAAAAASLDDQGQGHAVKLRKIRFEDDDSHNPDDPEKDSRLKYKAPVTSLQAKMLKMAGQQVPAQADRKQPAEREKRDEAEREERRTSRRRHRRGSSSDSDSDSDSEEERRRRRRERRRRRSRSSSSSSSSEDEREREKRRKWTEPGEQDREESLPATAPPTGPPGPPPGLPPAISAAALTAPTPPTLPPGPPPGLPPMMFRPPAPRAAATASAPAPRMLPPGPPPGRPPGMPPGPPPGLPPNMRAPPPRLPPGVPPPRMARPPGAPPGPPPGMLPPGVARPQVNPNILSAPPSIMKLSHKAGEEKKKSQVTIEAKPQIKNVMGDVTRFMPTALKVKREMKDAKGRVIKLSGKMEEQLPVTQTQPALPTQTKDDAYDAFMKEMEELF